MADKIRVGIVGATVTPGGSEWGAKAHVPALQALPGLELKAVCTAHEDTAKASAAKFGAELAFHDMSAMVSHPDIDLVTVVVRVPLHLDLVMMALRAGKPVCCEWPLAANLTEAKQLADCAKEHSLITAVGLQAQSNPAVMYARDIVANDDLGEILAVNLSVMVQSVTKRGDGRIWQGVRSNGANPMTIPGGHSIDAMCHIVGEFKELSARVTTRTTNWQHAVTGADFAVDAPDTVSSVGVLENGAEISYQLASVAHSPSGTRLEIYGRKGTLVLTSDSVNVAASHLHRSIGAEKIAALDIPDSYTLIPANMATGPGRNVAQAYARLAAAMHSGASGPPDFDHAVIRHRLIDAMERSSDTGSVIKFD